MIENKPATTALVSVPGVPISMPDVAVNSGGVMALVVSALLGFLAIRKRFSKDNLELTKDRAETNLIAAYQKTIGDLTERNKQLDENAREAWRTRAEDARRIGELSSKVEHLTEINANMTEQMTLQTETIRLLTESNKALMLSNTNLEARVNEMTRHVARIAGPHNRRT